MRSTPSISQIENRPPTKTGKTIRISVSHFFSLLLSLSFSSFRTIFFSFLSLWRNVLIFFHKVGFRKVFAAIQLGARLNESPCDRNWIGKQLAWRTRQSKKKNRLMIKWPVMKTTNELNEPTQWSTAGLDIEVDYALLMGLTQWSRFMQCGHKIGLRFCSTRLRSPLFFCSLPAPQWLNDQRSVCVWSQRKLLIIWFGWNTWKINWYDRRHRPKTVDRIRSDSNCDFMLLRFGVSTWSDRMTIRVNRAAKVKKAFEKVSPSIVDNRNIDSNLMSFNWLVTCFH